MTLGRDYGEPGEDRASYYALTLKREHSDTS